MARTPKNSPRMSRTSPATVGKITKKNKNLITNLKVESDASKSIVSSICTPRRMTRSFAKATHEEMPPPTSPLHTKKRKVNTSTKKSSLAVKQENEVNLSIRKGCKSMKLFAENVATESDSEDGLPSVSMLDQNETPILKIESHIDAELVETKPLAKQSSEKKSRKSKLSSITSVEPKLNTTFEMESEREENNEKTDLQSTDKHVAIKNRISVIDLTESPMIKKASPLNTTFSPLANILEQSEVELSDETFTEAKSEPTVQVVKSGPTPKSVKKTATQLKRLQAKTLLTTISESKSQTPITGILKQKSMSAAKKAKVLEAAKVIINEKNVTVTKPIGSVKKTPLKNGGSDAEKSSPFRFGATENKGRGFNFELVSKIPTWKELEKQKDQENNAKSGKFTCNNKQHYHFGEFKIFFFAVTKKAVPNFKAIHERMFEKDIALSDVQIHKSKRAEFIKSNKKVTNEGTPFDNNPMFVFRSSFNTVFSFLCVRVLLQKTSSNRSYQKQNVN